MQRIILISWFLWYLKEILVNEDSHEVQSYPMIYTKSIQLITSDKIERTKYLEMQFFFQTAARDTDYHFLLDFYSSLCAEFQQNWFFFAEYIMSVLQRITPMFESCDEFFHSFSATALFSSCSPRPYWIIYFLTTDFLLTVVSPGPWTEITIINSAIWLYSAISLTPFSSTLSLTTHILAISSKRRKCSLHPLWKTNFTSFSQKKKKNLGLILRISFTDENR